MEKINSDWKPCNKHDSYHCPYCSVLVSPEKTMNTKNQIITKSNLGMIISINYINSYLYFCNNCGRPTFQDGLQNNEYFPKKYLDKKLNYQKNIKKSRKDLKN